ncbi:hypothetical protein Poli38472_003439 [Pythium oligandrum]|uniref:Uncharacterized protein n=1 Tax=Pythium oligandrum TaxID=41045 RepID=A0A8K1C6T8_PYTOL|nr:hypothetical protein Poli38472_003439 [Pythium oligandrum]|eukprot:TMW57514.1 hypothetical protein Poli38472_003439 [Pythium oligandrum]
MLPSAPTPNPDAAPTATTLSVRVQRVRLLYCAFVTTTLIGGNVLFIRDGVTLLEFEAQQDGGNEADTQTLVDTYNAYTASVAAALGSPIAYVVGLIVQVVLLRFTTSLLEYLVLDGLSAINVQSRHLDFQPVISVSDLSVGGDNAVVMENVSSMLATFPETSPKNPIAKTVLHQAVLPHVMKPAPGSRECKVVAFSIPREDVINYGFPSRTWQRGMLPEALEHQVLRVAIGKNNSIPSEELPMNATRDASLFANGLMMSRTIFPWFWTSRYATDPEKPVLRAGESRTIDLASATGLLPDNLASRDEMARRAWFLQESHRILETEMSDTRDGNQSSEHAVAMEFAHVEISPNITFDAVTFQVELTADYMPGEFSFPNGTMYNQIDRKEACGPVPGVCVFGKPQYGNDPLMADVPAQINVLAACDNGELADGGVAYRYTNTSSQELITEVDCTNVSTSSLFVVSVGKYLVADKLEGKV